MLAKCEQKRLTNLTLSNYNKVVTADGVFLRGKLLGAENLSYNKYFKELKNNYAKTAYFTKAVWECSYLADFLANKKFEK